MSTIEKSDLPDVVGNVLPTFEIDGTNPDNSDASEKFALSRLPNFDGQLVYVKSMDDIGLIPAPLTIISIEDSPTSPGTRIQVNVTIGTNDYFTGQRVTISGGTAQDGDHDITRTDADSFEIAGTFTVTGTGTATALKRQAIGANIFQIMKSFDWDVPVLFTKGTGSVGTAKLIVEDVNLHPFNVTYTDVALDAPIQVNNGEASLLSLENLHLVANSTLKAADVASIVALMDPIASSSYLEKGCKFDGFALPDVKNTSIMDIDRPSYTGNKDGLKVTNCKDLRIHTGDWEPDSAVGASPFVEFLETIISGFGISGSGDGQLNSPHRVVVDSVGNYLVVDSGNNRIQKFSPKGEFLLQFGSFGTGAGQLNNPVGIAIDSSDNSFVVERNNHRVSKFDSSGNFVFTFGFGVGNGSPVFQVSFSGSQAGIAGNGDGQFDNPRGARIHPTNGNILVADGNNDRIQIFTSTPTFSAEFGTTGTGNGQFDTPHDVIVDAAGNYIITDFGNARIQKLDSGFNFLGEFGSFGTANGEFIDPIGIALDAAENMYITDSGNNRIQKFQSDFTFLDEFGSIGSNDNQFQTPRGIAINLDGNLVIVDQANNKVKTINTDFSAGTYKIYHPTMNVPTGGFAFQIPTATSLNSQFQIIGGDYGTAITTKFVSPGLDQTDSRVFTSNNIGIPDTAIPATNIADGSVDDTEFQTLNGVTSSIQTQIDAVNVTANLNLPTRYIQAKTADDIAPILTKSNITAFTDVGAGEINVTSINHELDTNNSVVFSGGTPYDGITYLITKIDDDTFEFSETFTTTGTGTWTADVRKILPFLSGAITAVADGGGGTSIFTSVNNKLLVNDRVKITDTTSYNGSSLKTTAVTTNTFTLPITFVGSETGNFAVIDVAYEIQSRIVLAEQILIDNIGLYLIGKNPTFDTIKYEGNSPSMFRFVNAEALRLTNVGLIGNNSKKFNTGTFSTFTFAFYAAVGSIIDGFIDMPLIEDAAFVTDFDNFYGNFFTTGIIYKNVGNINVTRNVFLSFNDVTKTFITIDSPVATTIAKFTGCDFPVQSLGTVFDIKNTLTANSRIEIVSNTARPAGIIFDAAGLDQTDPRILSNINIDIEDSMASAQIGFTNITTPIVVTIGIQDVPVIIGGTQFISSELERSSATTGGEITNLSKKTQRYNITFSGLIEKVGGGATDIGLLLIKNGSLVLTNTFEIPHSVNAGIIQISATRILELAENDTVDIAVVNFSGTADISVSQANIVYAERA